ncbi:extracellular solute-binding protein [Cohnella zeiphila]|uniref:Extracellular solute-binding protein n=1 Tax=Cohnella zeiphila TaxID=2761120 RepID=A0A7X0VVM8_9BACL|nr:extracellular solute-binding protein [Cohnella zeiphila]MBB6732324.1 extracellular solute-binding protein [Cohnella zeiphila]
MKGFRRTQAVAALLALALPLAACSGNGKEEAASSAGSSAASSDKPIEISWLSFNPPENDSTPVQQALEKKFNVKFKNVRVERANYDEQMNIKFSSGEVADLIYLDFSPQRLETLVNQGILAELPEDEIRGKMPEYAGTIDQADPTLWDYSKVNGKGYGIPVIWPIGDLPFLPGYNGDWLKKIGYDAPPTTLDQFEDVLRKFRNDDPDGNGQKDTYGLSGQGTDARSFSVVFGAFGVRPDYMVDEKTKQVVYGLTTEQGREALKVINRWYKEDLIDPEFVTKTANDYHDDFVNGIVGVRDWMSYQFEPRVGIVGAPFYAKNPNNKIVVGKPLAGPNGPGKAYSYGSQNAFIAMGKQVEKDPAKKAKLYEILNALATDDSTYLTAVYGIEGEHYQMQDGVPIMKPEYANENAKYKIGAGTFYGVFGTKSKLMEKYDYTQDTLKFIDSLRDGVQTIDSLAVYVPAMTEYPDLGKLASESYLKFVRGELNLDADFDKFVQDWNDAGGKEILRQINEKYTFGS